MNVMPDSSVFVRPEEPTIDAEKAVLSGCLIDPSRILAAASIVRPEHFAHPFNARVWREMLDMASEGATPSIEMLVATIGNDEIEAGVTVRSYLAGLIHKGAVVGMFAPWRDAAEALVDGHRRRLLSDVGQSLIYGTGVGRVQEIAARAIERIDDVLADMRAGKRSVYSGGEAGQHALDMLDATTTDQPTTGLVDLDKALGGGWPLGELSVLAGRPGMGKSAVMASSAVRAARKGYEQLIFSLEMTKAQLGARMLTDLAYTHDHPIAYADVAARRIDDWAKRRLQAAATDLKALPITIEEQRGLTMSEIAARARKHAARLSRQGLSLSTVWVDHIGIVKASSRYAGNRVYEMGEITDGLATLAKELGCAVVALCQLSRAVEGRDNKRPAMSDLRSSGEIEQDASVVAFCYRAAYYLENMRFDDDEKEARRQDMLQRARNDLELILAKNRNGSTGVVDAFCAIGSNALRDAAFAM